MYQAIAYFNFENFEEDPVTLIGQVVNQWRYNGQIIGREFGVTYHQDHFQVRLSLPEQESLLPKWNSEMVNEALQQAVEFGVIFTGFEIIGQDYQADESSQEDQYPFLILYTTHLDSCSPLRSANDFKSIPSYRLLHSEHDLSEQLIKWQEDWQACDQLQMNGLVLEQQAVSQIGEVDSELSIRGRALAKEIEQKTSIPVFYYLYRLGKDEAKEQSRTCPSCGGSWKLTTPLHDIFYFKCEQCRLISNLSWEIL